MNPQQLHLILRFIPLDPFLSHPRIQLTAVKLVLSLTSGEES
jgi:hypothetical protein